MSWNNLIGYMELLAFPVFIIVLTVVTVVVSVALVRFLHAACRLANARRRILEAEASALAPTAKGQRRHSVPRPERTASVPGLSQPEKAASQAETPQPEKAVPRPEHAAPRPEHTAGPEATGFA